LVTCKTWKIAPRSDQAQQLARETPLTPLQAQILINRGIVHKDAALSFFSPRLSDMIDPTLLADMKQATALVLKALDRDQKITVYGDYDADGLTATALLYHFFASLGIQVSYYIPNRFGEGYGLNARAVRRIAGMGTGLMITVDCGISDGDEIALAKELGVEVIITDHHQVPADFRRLCPVVNPHRPDCPFPGKDLAGVGLAFLLTVSVRAALRERGWFRRDPEPDLREYLDLVAIGTVADRVPLLNQNRIFVKAGIEALARTRWQGLEALKKVSNVPGPGLSAQDLAFRLAPRLNAPGRMGEPLLGIEILTVKESHSADTFAIAVNRLNDRRQSVERQILGQIESLFRTEGGIEERKTLVLAGEDWHAGVLGIVASRLVDKYHKPCLVISHRDGMAVGSGRSIDGFNLHQALSRLAPLFDKFGGHAHAAGFRLKTENLEALKRELEGLATELLIAEDLVPSLKADGEILLQDITYETIEQLEVLAPFGEGNPEPLFLARSLQVRESKVVGNNHLRLRVRQGEKSFDAIGFGLGTEPPVEGETVDMVFTPEINRWQGSARIQLRLADFQRAYPSSVD
jgi:single-stranded-DNA-specific exonuclease